jgi:hypothetical protein
MDYCAKKTPRLSASNPKVSGIFQPYFQMQVIDVFGAAVINVIAQLAD